MKKRFGDRRDGTLLRDLDSMHVIMPIIYPNRCDNEAFISECIDLTNADAWPEKQNANDPYYNSVILTNLGSIKLHAGYHHLTNRGTTSVFCIVGERKLRPFYDGQGNMTMRDSVDIGLTVDERIADGYYYSKTVRLFRKLPENPELLELPLDNEVDY